MRIVEVTQDDPRLIACQKAYFSEISIRFGRKFDPYAGENPEADAALQWHVLALDGEMPEGCGSLRDLGERISEVKRVWVADAARGSGIGGRLMDWLEYKARDEGFIAIRLDTNKTLDEAQSLYRKRGYREIERYNDNPFADHFFEKRTDLITVPETS